MSDSVEEELSRRISEYPERALPFFRSSFAVASNLKREVLDGALDELVANFKRGKRSVAGAKLGPITGLNAKDSEQIASIFSLVIGLLFESEASAGQFVVAARGKLFLEKDESVAHSMANAICERRSEISATIERAQLAGAILPSLTSFEVAVDIRVKVVEGKIKTAAPVAVVYLDTDAENREFCLQMVRGDMEDIIRKLNSALNDMKIASDTFSIE